jgi:hypothetical protein
MHLVAFYNLTYACPATCFVELMQCKTGSTYECTARRVAFFALAPRLV